MTLCISAAAKFKENPALVMVSDTRSLSSSREWGLSISSENAEKMREIGRFQALIAGDPTEADSLLAQCMEAIEKFSIKKAGPDSDLHYDAFFHGLREGAGRRMKQIQDHFIAMNSPFKGLDDFLLRGKVSLPDLQYREIWSDIQRLHLNSEVIVGGFHGDEIVMVKIDTKGQTHWMDQYAVIGTGSAEALSFLAQNQYDETKIQLEDCLLRLVEALEFASIANNTVGGFKRTAVFLPDGSEWDVKDSFFDEVLKPKIRLASISALGDCGDFLERIDDDEVSSKSEQTGESADAGNEQAGGSGSGSTERGDSATGSGV
jgi:hypothetical protein